MRASAFGLILSALLAVPVTAQTSVPDVMGLLELPGREAWVRYTPGALDRAAHVQEWLRLLALEGAKATGEPRRLGAFVLDRREWESTDLQAPYGAPRALGEGRVVLPAYGDDGTVAFWRRYQPRGLPGLGGMPLRGTEAEASSLFVSDHLALLETARQLVEYGDTRGETAWIQELLAHAFLLQALHPEVGGRVRWMDEFWEQITAAVGDPGTLSSYGSGLTFDEWLGHQAAIYRLARAMEAEESRFMGLYDRFRKLGRKGGGVLTQEGLKKRYGDLVD